MGKKPRLNSKLLFIVLNNFILYSNEAENGDEPYILHPFTYHSSTPIKGTLRRSRNTEIASALERAFEILVKNPFKSTLMQSF